jgi:outer membrane lipoprotein-sorting protein
MYTRIAISSLAALLSVTAAAEQPEELGLAIAKEMDARDHGWMDSQTELLMILRNRQGEESTRELRTKTLEIQGDGDKSLTIFGNPRDVKGSAFLSFTHPLIPDDQWLYLPALKRVKRISSANKSGPFMGSEFSYEDLSSFEVPKYRYKWLHDESLNGIDCFVIERYPLYEYSGYTREIAWIDKNIYHPVQIEYYDRKSALLKTLTFHEYKQYLDVYWRADRMEMVNHQTGKSTTLKFKNYRFKTGLTDRDFDRNSLKRAR